MVGMEQIRKGIARYIAQELAPQMSVAKAVALEAFGPTVIEGKLRKLAGEWLEGTELMDGGSINVGEAYRLFKQASSGRWPMEIMGVRFSESDLDKLYQYIKEG